MSHVLPEVWGMLDLFMAFIMFWNLFELYCMALPSAVYTSCLGQSAQSENLPCQSESNQSSHQPLSQVIIMPGLPLASRTQR